MKSMVEFKTASFVRGKTAKAVREGEEKKCAVWGSRAIGAIEWASSGSVDVDRPGHRRICDMTSSRAVVNSFTRKIPGLNSSAVTDLCDWKLFTTEVQSLQSKLPPLHMRERRKPI